MALMFSRAIFFHIEKTGGEWVKQAIRRAGIPARALSPFGDHGPQDEHCYPEHVDTRGKLTFTFVRNPLDWYASMWAFRMMHGWNNTHPLSVCQSDDFQQFLRKVLVRFPGFVSQLYESYAGPPPGRLDFVGHQETLADDLIRALRLAGERFDPRIIRSTPLANVSFGHRGLYPPDLRRAVERGEWRAMVRFGYAGRGLHRDHPVEKYSTSRRVLGTTTSAHPTRRHTMAPPVVASASRYPRRHDHVVWKVIEGKGILLNLEDGAYFEVDPTALAIWQRCDGRTPIEAVARGVAEAFDADARRVARDLAVFLQELARRKLLDLLTKPRPATTRL